MIYYYGVTIVLMVDCLCGKIDGVFVCCLGMKVDQLKTKYFAELLGFVC